MNEGTNVDLTYVKADGTRRVITATKVDPDEGSDPSRITVYDKVVDDWRTVIIDNIEQAAYQE